MAPRRAVNKIPEVSLRHRRRRNGPGESSDPPVSLSVLAGTRAPVQAPPLGESSILSGSCSRLGTDTYSGSESRTPSTARKSKHSSGKMKNTTTAAVDYSSDDSGLLSVSELGEEIDIDTVDNMEMRAVPARTGFSTEKHDCNSSIGGMNADKIPEVVIAPTRLESKGQLMSDDDLDSVGQFIIKGAAVGFILWIFLMANIYLIAPADSYEYLTGTEKQATWTLIILLFATNTTRIIPLAFQKNGFQFSKSGLVVGSFTVQFIAIVSNWISVVFPTPVMIDPVSGLRIHLMRFAVWAPLAFLMTFLTEAVDLNWHSNAPLQQAFQAHSPQVAWWHAGFMALSTICGALFPFTKSRIVWWEIMIISWLLYATIFIRLYQRYCRYRYLEQQQRRQIPKHTHQTRGHNFLLNEAVDRSRRSLQLILTCCICWTLIAGNFTVCSFLPNWAEKNSIWASPELSYVIGTGLEAISKVYYLVMQLNVYDQVFDTSARSARRLEEMRTLMSALWEASTDVLVICAETDSFIHAVVSPHPLLESEIASEDPGDIGKAYSSTILEISKFDNSFVSFPMNLSEPGSKQEADHVQTQQGRNQNFNSDFKERDTTRGKNLATIAKVAKKACYDQQAWKDNGASWSLVEMMQHDPDREEDIPVTCEAKVTGIECGGVLLVLRDVSERYQRFEVEKALLEEVIVRKKDAESIRFTRHEVKNGLLAAMGIVDVLKEQLQITSEEDEDSHMQDLDAALKEILESILDNAMIREVVYEGYVPRNQNLDLTQLLDARQRERSACGGAREGNVARKFPLFATPDPFPHLMLDPQLIRKIYQNAVSNACKYGKKNGDVTTFLSYDMARHVFRMKVHNEPGYNHRELLELSVDEAGRVFKESTQLDENQRLDTEEGRLKSARSAGDGAWIMQKCAVCLGGSCKIEYLANGTTLTFECPAKISDEWKEQHQELSATSSNFVIPPSTWAIAVEDSPIQQKLLAKFLQQTGFQGDHILILGKTAEEIYDFTDIICKKMMENPQDKFVLIIDENLDIMEGGAVTATVSGSFSIHQLRKSLGEDEQRMLALIRSANDSVEEVELYQSRAHGFLLKGPMKKGGFLEEIRPWWIRRFETVNQIANQEPCRSETERNVVGAPSGLSRTMLTCGVDRLNNDEWLYAKKRIVDLVDSIDKLTYGTGRNEAVDWQLIRYKLLLLNIDLKINSSRDRLALAASAIDDVTNFAGTDGVPAELPNRWLEIRSMLTKELGAE